MILVTLDSLIDIDEDVCKGKIKVPSTCGKCYAEYWNNMCEVEKFNNYDDLEEKVRNLIKHMVSCIYKNDLGEEPPPIDVIVSPSIGSPGGRWKFKGGVGDFTAKTLLKVGLILDKILDDCRQIKKLCST